MCSLCIVIKPQNIPYSFQHCKCTLVFATSDPYTFCPILADFNFLKILELKPPTSNFRIVYPAGTGLIQQDELTEGPTGVTKLKVAIRKLTVARPRTTHPFRWAIR